MAWRNIQPVKWGHENKTWREIFETSDINTVFTRGEVEEQERIEKPVDNTPKNTKEEMDVYYKKSKECEKYLRDTFYSKGGVSDFSALDYFRYLKLKKIIIL